MKVELKDGTIFPLFEGLMSPGEQEYARVAQKEMGTIKLIDSGWSEPDHESGFRLRIGFYSDGTMEILDFMQNTKEDNVKL